MLSYQSPMPAGAGTPRYEKWRRNELVSHRIQPGTLWRVWRWTTTPGVLPGDAVSSVLGPLAPMLPLPSSGSFAGMD